MFGFLKRKTKIIEKEVVKKEYVYFLSKKIKAEPDDVIILSTTTVLSENGHKNLSTSLKKFWPDNEVIILEQGSNIETAKRIYYEKV